MDRKKEALFHDTTSQFCVKDTVLDKYIFTLRALPGNNAQYFICINDIKIPLVLSKRTEYFQYLYVEASLKPGVNKYYFRIEEQNETYFYNQLGVCDKNPQNHPFEITPGFETPEWAKGSVMYQIMTDRFCNGDKTNDVQSNEYAYIGKAVTSIDDWSQPPAADDTREFYGGDIQGIIDKMEYLEKLGVDAIYLNPIFVSPSNHKYDTQDYDYVDPHIGKIVKDGGHLLNEGDINNSHASKYKMRTADLENLEASNELFKEMVQCAHSHGIKVIIDGVFNHCGSFNKWMDREGIYRENADYNTGAFESGNSPYKDFFRFHDESWPDNSSYEGWWGFDTLPKLNYEGSEELCQYILNIGKKWVSPPYNVDGWRLDVAADLSHSSDFNHSFWKRFRDAVKSVNPNAIIIAEHYGDANSWLQGDQWDTVMNYDAFMEPVTWFLTGVDKHSDSSKPELFGNGQAFVDTMNYQMSRMQNQSLQVAMNQLSNHDHSRFMTRTNRMVGRLGTLGTEAAEENIDHAIFKQGVVMQMTLPGAPTLYYGDEAGVCGWTDPDNRRTYPWGKEDLEILEFYREAICVHKQNQVLKTGSYRPLIWGDGYLAYGRFDEKNAAVVVINTDTEDITLEIPTWILQTEDGKVYSRVLETYKKLYNCGRVKEMQKNGNLTIVVKAQSSAIYIA